MYQSVCTRKRIQSMARLIATKVEALKGSKKLLGEQVALGGSLIARGLSKGVGWYYQYKYEGKLHRFPFGSFSPSGDSKGSTESTTYTLAGARARAIALAALQQQHGDLSAFMREKRITATEQLTQAKKERTKRKQDIHDYSLANLCEAYWKHLETEGKPSARDVRNGLRLWVVEKQPELASTKASEITTENILVILRAIIDAGRTTTTNRVRSYLSAAYTFGLGSTTDPLASARASGFSLTSNPVAPVKRVASFERAGNRVLSKQELAKLLHRLQEQATPASTAVTLAIRLGGQRIKQLLAVLPIDIDHDNETITLRDSKGRRALPRLHVLPLTPESNALIEHAMSSFHPANEALFGKLTLDTVSKLVRSISKEMEQSGSQPYCWRDLRRTCETMMAAMGISKDLRAQIQSHGLSGVQEKHYDRHDYIGEKRNALAAWNGNLNELMTNQKTATNVVHISR